MSDWHIRGTSLGGWLVLEPWITPSLFYQFLLTPTKALGGEEANRQLRQHWRAWVTEDHIAQLKSLGVDTLRIPIGDWMYVPYEPFHVCMLGAREELDRALALCAKYEINVLLDIHALRGSQNGLDNSGTTGNMRWFYDASGQLRYEHWAIRAGNWIGPFNLTSNHYEYLNLTNFEHSLSVVREVVRVHGDNPVVIGIEPVNEPDIRVPIEWLKGYYREAYRIVQAGAPHWISMFHDSFRLSPDVWALFLQDCNNCVMDTHIYEAWKLPQSPEWYARDICTTGSRLRELKQLGVEVVVGEWSLATDNCAMWINGFNDNVYGFPNVECKRVVCAEPYLSEMPRAPPGGPWGPFGTGESFVVNGTCPIDKDFPDNDAALRSIASAQLSAYDTGTRGQLFWNFRTELEPRWDFIQAVTRGWLPRINSSSQSTVADYCLQYPTDAPSFNPTAAPTVISSVSPAVTLTFRSGAAVTGLFCVAIFLFLCMHPLFKQWNAWRQRLLGYSILQESHTSPQRRRDPPDSSIEMATWQTSGSSGSV